MEYQYYDFHAVDRPLTESEIGKLRAISTRATITAASFTNHYEWGDLKADPSKLLERYFDAFVYVANWSIHMFHLRLPHASLPHRQAALFLRGETVQARRAGKFIILEFENDVENDDPQDDGTGWMASLLPLRSDLLRGDLRCLYLGWLLCAQNEEFDEDELEPPVSPGLRELSAPLLSLIEFLQIDQDLVKAAALASAPMDAGPDRKELAKWIRSLPEKEKNDLLIAAASENAERWKADLWQRWRQQSGRPSPAPTLQRRSVGDLLRAALVET